MKFRVPTWLHRRWFPAALTAVATAAAIADAVWLSTIATSVLLSCTTPGSTFVRRQLAALLVLLGLSSSLFTLLAIVHVETDPRWLVLTIALGAFLISVSSPSQRVAWGDAADAWSVGAAVVAVAVVARSAIGWNSAEILARLARHTDGIRHIALGAAVEQHGGYVTFTSDPHQLPGLQHYPQGGAGLMAILLRAFGGHHPDIATTIVVGFWVLVAVLGVMTWAFTSLAFCLMTRMATTERRGWMYPTVATVGVATIAIGPHFLVYEPGYFTQDLATISLFVFLAVMSQSALNLKVAVTQVLLVVGIAQTWYLLLPVAVASGGWWWWKQPRRRTAVVPVVLSAAFVLFPMVTGPSPTKQLVAIGGTPTPNRIVVASMLIGGGAALVVLLSRSRSARIDAVYTAALAALASLMVLVGMTELLFASTQSAYYALKLFVLTLIFAGLGLAIALPTAVRSHHEGDGVLATAMAIALVVVTAASWGRFEGNTSKAPSQNVREASLYLQTRPSIASGDLAVIYDGCDSRDRFLTHALTTLGHQFAPSRLHDMTLFMNSRGSPPRGLAHLSRDPGVSSLTVFTSRPCAPRDLRELGQLSHIKVVGDSTSP